MSDTFRRDQLRNILREQGRTLTWLARLTGVSRATVYAYMRGARRPSVEWIDRAAAALGVPASLLRTEEAA